MMRYYSNRVSDCGNSAGAHAAAFLRAVLPTPVLSTIIHVLFGASLTYTWLL